MKTWLINHHSSTNNINHVKKHLWNWNYNLTTIKIKINIENTIFKKERNIYCMKYRVLAACLSLRDGCLYLNMNAYGSVDEKGSPLFQEKNRLSAVNINLLTYHISHVNNTFDKNIRVFIVLEWSKPHLLEHFCDQFLK